MSRERILRLIPHQFSMCLLDTIVDWDFDRVHCRSSSHRAIDNPLRSGGRLRSVHLCEYGAQAMAVHGGLLTEADGQPAAAGMLVSLRGVQLARPWLDDLDGELDVCAERLLAGEASWQYRFVVSHRGGELASGRAAVMLQR